MSAEAQISEATRFLVLPRLRLECGAELSEVRIAYRTWGELAPSRDNAVLICHALTGSADADLWWPGLMGPGRALDPASDFILCSNVLGGCYGSTGPTSPVPGGGRWYGPDFPPVTVRDMVRAQHGLLDALGVERLALVLGGSLGGMQALEWAAMFPERVEAFAPISTSGRHSPWCIGFSAAQRQAVTADPDFEGGWYEPGKGPRRGLGLARQIAMLTYRSRQGFERRFGRSAASLGRFEIESYLDYQGEKLALRFDANTYLTLTRAMDSHDLGRERGAYEEVLAGITQPALVVTCASDLLYQSAEQEELARLLPRATLAHLASSEGHDAFLIEIDELSQLIREFRSSVARKAPALYSVGASP